MRALLLSRSRCSCTKDFCTADLQGKVGRSSIGIRADISKPARKESHICIDTPIERSVMMSTDILWTRFCRRNQRFRRKVDFFCLHFVPPARRRKSALEEKGASSPLQLGRIRAIVGKGAVPLLQAVSQFATGPKSVHRKSDDSIELAGRREFGKWTCRQKELFTPRNFGESSSHQRSRMEGEGRGCTTC